MNRRRLSGHRTGGGAAPFAIRAPWAVYELDGSGIDAVGNGPEMSLSGEGAGRIGSGAFVANAGSSNNFAFLLTGGSFGLWYHVQEGEPTSGSGLVAASVNTPEGNFEFQVTSDGETILIGASGDNTVSVSLPGITPGWNYFGFSRNGNSTQFIANGGLVGSPATLTPASGSFANDVVTLVDGGGRFDQPMYSTFQYTADEWAYIYNAGAGLAYSAWNVAP